MAYDLLVSGHLIGGVAMNIVNELARRLIVLSLLSVGLATTAFAKDEATRFAGPRGTIPLQQRGEPSANQPSGGLQASRNAAAACQVVRIVHHGHPAKGVDRFERVDVPCGKTRLSTR